MCGITGIIDHTAKINETVLNKMVATLTHRGPDDSGISIYNSKYGSIGLGHTRLSILDLSSYGHQPMHYKQFSIVYNGEVYNFKEIRQELLEQGHKFNSNSDTEVILHSFDEWGVGCVDKFIGMFAFSIFDKNKEILYLFRDRAGVKPLYYYFNDQLFLFASELKSMLKHPKFSKEIDFSVLPKYFDFGYIPAPKSIYKNTFKLEPGHYLKYSLESKNIEINEYWSASHFYSQPKLDISYNEAIEELEKLLENAFQYRMISDVPVGVFLSGGYDSAIVTALLQKNNAQKLKTYTIGFKEGNNEAPFAKQTAEYLGTDHHEYICTTKEAQDIIPQLPYFYDEPFADSSAVPTILVSRFARKHVTVALSADGGDEIFAGYGSYLKFNNYLNRLKKIPNQIRPAVEGLLKSSLNFIPESKVRLKHRLDGLSKSLKKDDWEMIKSLWFEIKVMPSSYLNNLFNYDLQRENIVNDGLCFTQNFDFTLCSDFQNYLPNDILTKVDRATMSISLEGREPLLDHRILEFAARLPLKYKMNKSSGKIILKDVLHKYIPKELMDRKKSGFSIPMSSWLRGDLNYLLNEYLSEDSIKESNIFRSKFVQEKLKLFRDNKLHYTPFIWKILMFQMWYRSWDS